MLLAVLVVAALVSGEDAAEVDQPNPPAVSTEDPGVPEFPGLPGVEAPELPEIPVPEVPETIGENARSLWPRFVDWLSGTF